MAQTEGNGRTLDSWKAIADYLGVTVRTVQRWEREHGLPVRRLGGAKGRLTASAAELDRWKTTLAERPGPWSNLRVLRISAVASVALALLLAAWILRGYVSRVSMGPPAMFHFAFRTLIVADTDGREVFHHAFDRPIVPGYYTPEANQRLVWFGDLDGDGRVETLFVYCPSDTETTGTELYCFSDRGAVKWRFIPGHEVSNGERTYSQTYATTNLAVLRDGSAGRLEIVLTSRHVVNSPAQVALLDARGRLAGEYWHYGHVDRLAISDLDGDGREDVLVGGVNNGWGAATLVALDTREMTGTSFQGENSQTQIKGYPTGREKAVLLFPRSCVSRKFDAYNMVKAVEVVGDQIHVDTVERLSEPQAAVLYVLDKKLNLVSFEFTDVFRALHRSLALDGFLDHTLTDRETEQARNIRYLRRAF